MANTGRKQCENWIPALLVALLLGVGLHELFRLWPSIVTEFLSPVNESIWEHIKVVFWPLLLVELGCYTAEHRPQGLLALFLSCTGMLAAGWLYHIVFGGSALWVDLLIYGMCIFAYFLISEAQWAKNAPLPLMQLLTAGLIALIVLFTLSPPHGVLFSEVQLASAWTLRLC
jgi:hypothetical protein